MNQWKALCIIGLMTVDTTLCCRPPCQLKQSKPSNWARNAQDLLAKGIKRSSRADHACYRRIPPPFPAGTACHFRVIEAFECGKEKPSCPDCLRAGSQHSSTTRARPRRRDCLFACGRLNLRGGDAPAPRMSTVACFVPAAWYRRRWAASMSLPPSKRALSSALPPAGALALSCRLYASVI